MAKKVDLLEVQPSGKLIFTGPFDKAGKADLVLKNLTYKQLIYKVSYVASFPLIFLCPSNKLPNFIEMQIKPDAYNL